MQGFVFAQNENWSFEIPEVKSTDTVIVHAAFSLMYSEKNEQASWVAYQLLQSNSGLKQARSNRFLVDPIVKTGSATTQDYLKSGYDRGHLAPAADFGWSVEAMNESFYYSNMSPQLPGFNRGIWKKLETQVRNWASLDSCIYVVTGPILNDSLKKIGPNGVSVPRYYYKVILDFYSKSPKGIGFILPNESSSASLLDFAIPIGEVEKITGINFFPSLNQKQVHELEQQVCLPCWTWSVSKTENDEIDDVEIEVEEVKSKEVNSNLPLSQAVQCTGTTKSGNRCGNKTKNASQRCHLHLK